MDRQLFLILKPYDDWADGEDEIKNWQARQALLIFYDELSKRQPDKHYHRRDVWHLQYVRHLVEIKSALTEAKYILACNELISLMHYEPFLQLGIWYNVMETLRNSLGIGEGYRMNENTLNFIRKYFNKQRHDEDNRPDTKSEFGHAMDFVGQVLAFEKSKKDKLVILNYMMDVIRTDLQYDIMTTILYSEEHFKKDIGFIFPICCYDESGGEIRVITEDEKRTVHLGKDCVLVLPWNRERLRGSIKNIHNNDFIYHRTNHLSYYFTHMDICYVYNGTHSVSSGIGHKKGTIEARVCDVSRLFEHLSTDGKSWINTHTSSIYPFRVDDFRIAILYEIAKTIYFLEK